MHKILIIVLIRIKKKLDLNKRTNVYSEFREYFFEINVKYFKS